jgi:hypothetical protein
MADSSLDTSLPATPHDPPKERYAPSRVHPYRPEPVRAPLELTKRPDTQPARPRELIVALGLVAVADFALVRRDGFAHGGYGMAVFFAVVPMLLVLAARAWRFSLRLAVLGAMLLAVAARSAYASSPEVTLFGLGAVFALTTVLRARRAFVTDVLRSFVGTFVTFPRRLAAAFEGAHRVLAGTGRDGRTPSNRLAQVMVPLALVALFVAIFGLANPVVGHWLAALRSSVEWPAALRLFTWAGLAIGAVLLLRPALGRKTTSESAMPTPTTPEAWDVDDAREAARVAITRNALVALNVLFAGYHALDAVCLVTGSPPAGTSEREYAHQGTFWLTVALFATTVVVGVMFRGRLAYAVEGRWSRGLAYAWLAQGLVLALGTYRRIAIHVATSGLSSLRLFGILGTTLVLVGSIAVGVKLLRRRTFGWLLRRQLDAVALGLCLYVVVPTHLVSARVNVGRVLDHEYTALVHTEEEAREAESAVALLPLVHHDDDRIRKGISALLLNERDRLRQRRAKATTFRDLDFASTRSLAILEAASPELETTLGDVDRPEAIVPFEYIRNSAIEGEIAQSEIARVKPPRTRTMKAALEWLDRQDAFVETSETFPEVRMDERPTSAPGKRRLTMYAHGKDRGGLQAIELELSRDSASGAWQVERTNVSLARPQ